jgi:hypothetical protein
MIYGLQHFSAIEGGYRVESEKQALDQLREENRQLRLAEAQLTQPGRIDMMARQLGSCGAAAGPGDSSQCAGPDAGAPVDCPGDSSGAPHSKRRHKFGSSAYRF